LGQQRDEHSEVVAHRLPTESHVCTHRLA
jgi:hypothetical protein